MLGSGLTAQSLVVIGLSVYGKGTRRNVNEADFMVGVCYRPPSQDKEAGKIFHKHLGELSRSLTIILMGHFELTSCQLEIIYSGEETF